jgi:hypothetical protein
MGAAAEQTVVIQPPKFKTVEFLIKGTAPYVQHRFWKKGDIMETQRAGSQAKSKKRHEPRNFERDYEESKHKSKDGWCGIPASSFRNASISACRIAGFVMTRAKLAIFVEADGLDQDGMPIVRINGESEMHTAYARNDNGSVDIRSRPMWREWTAKVRIRFDADMFSETDVANLLHRVGQQVGLGEGRPDSKESAGLGWGLFEIVTGEAA